MKKKLLAIILSAALVCAMLPFAMFSAFATKDLAGGVCGAEYNNVNWILYEDGLLVIYGTGDMAEFDGKDNNPPWNYSFENVTEVVVEIQSGVTSISNYAFEDCSKLTSVTIPSSVTSIGRNAFAYCSSLTEITIPDGVTSIGKKAFMGCSGLTSITIPESVTSFGDDVFDECDEDLVIYGYDYSAAEAYAEEYSLNFVSLNEAPAVPTFQAIYGLLNDGMTNPAETFSFTIAKVGVTDSDNYNLSTMPMFDPATYTISFANGEATLAGDSNETELTLPTYEHVGIFTYTITQTAGTTAGVTYDDTVIYMVITATQGAHGIETTVAMHYGLNGEKTSFLTNTYSAGELAITGSTTGNLSDLDKEFDVTVTFTRETGKTGDLVIGYIEDGVEYTVEGSNGVYEAEIHIKNGETITFTNIPYGTTYTVVEADYTGEGYDAAVYSVADIDTTGATMGAAANPLTITNNKDVLIDTGVLLNSMPYAIALSGIIGAAVIVLLAKKKRKEVEED